MIPTLASNQLTPVVKRWYSSRTSARMAQPMWLRCARAARTCAFSAPQCCFSPRWNFRHFDFGCPAQRVLLPVNALPGGPVRDRHRQILDTARAVRLAVDQRVRQETLVVAGGEVGALVRAARLLAPPGGLDN